MRKAKAYWRIFCTAAKEDSANPKRLISAILQMIGRVLLVVAIYKVAYGASDSHQALTFTNAMWTIGLCFAFFLNLGIRNLYQPVEREIKDGTVETGLIKPLDWRLVKFLQLLGKSGPEFIVQLMVLSLVLLLAVGTPSMAHLTPVAGLSFGLFLVMSIVTSASLFMTVGLSAFWLNDAKSVFRVVDKLALICCGTFVPLALLPDFIQKLIIFTPFTVYAAPTRLFDPTAIGQLPVILVSAVVWMFVMLGVCQLVWHRASRKIEVNGG